jgi:hypothetical protein
MNHQQLQERKQKTQKQLQLKQSNTIVGNFQSHKPSGRSHCSTCRIGRRSSLAVLFAGWMFFSVAQCGDSASIGTWANASSLSIARGTFAATSLPNYGLAIFGGGNGAYYVCVDAVNIGVDLCGGVESVCGTICARGIAADR